MLRVNLEIVKKEVASIWTKKMFISEAGYFLQISYKGACVLAYSGSAATFFKDVKEWWETVFDTSKSKL